MKLDFIFGRKRKRVIETKQREASLVHKKNIQSIVESRQDANKLKEVLRQNNITIEIAGAIGHN